MITRVIEPRTFEYPASGRVRTGTLYKNENDAARPVIVVVHGLLVDRTLPELEDLCARLATIFDVVAIDLRGHGRAPGLFTWGREEKGDLADLVSFLSRLHPRVGILGFSIGGYIAILSAAGARAREDHGLPDAVCTIGAPAHLDLWRFRFRPIGFLRHARLILRRRRRIVRPSWRGLRGQRAVDVVADLAPVPLLIIHGGRDWLVQPDQAWQLYRAAAPPREILMLEEACHAEYILAQDPEWLLRPIRAFFRRTLREAESWPRPDDVQLSLDRP
jgi:pimeloyl-ACP methyl ester carboxylesterase